jgi:hypothetical protein
VALSFVVLRVTAGPIPPPTVNFSSTAFTTGQTGTNSGVLQVEDYNGDGAGDVLVATNGGVVSFKGQFTAGVPNGALGSIQTSTMSFSACGGASTISAARGKINSFGPVWIVLGVNTVQSDVFNLLGQNNGWFNTSATCGGMGGGSPASLTWMAAGDVDPNSTTSAGYVDAVGVNGGSSIYLAQGAFGTTTVNGFSTSFALPNSLTNASTVAMADLNGDGYNDIVVGAGSSIATFPNQKTGTFSTQFSAASASSAALSGVSDNVKRVAVADVTGDGKPDIVAITATKIAVIVGDGTGSIAGPQTTITLPAGFTGNSVTVADFNGDGFPDLAVAAQGTGGASNSVVLIYYGAGMSGGAPTFSSVDQKQIGSNPSAILTPVDIAAFDMNRDGHPDIVVSTQSDNNVWVLLNTFPSLVPTDGKNLQFNAVVGAANPAPVTVTIGTSDSGTVPGLLLSTPATPPAPSWVTTSLSGNQLTITPNIAGAPGPGIYRGTAVISQNNSVAAATHYARTVITYSVNIVAQSGTWIYGGESGNAQGQVSTYPADMAAGDFNGDGVPDLLAPSSGGGSTGLGVYIRNGLTWTTPASNKLLPSGTAGGDSIHPSVAVGDFNLDGKLDAVGVDNAGDITVAFGDGTGGFLPYMQYLTQTNPLTVVVADINGDGYPDILVGLQAVNANNPGGIAVLLNDGTGKFTQSLLNPNNSYYSLAVADFNGDGIVDIVASNRTLAGSGFTAASSIDLFQGKGGGVFQAPTHLNFAESGTGTCNCTHPQPLATASNIPNLHSIVAGDFNGDGRPDIAFLDNPDANNFSNTWVVVALASLDNNHNVTFALTSQKGIHPAFGSLRSLTIGDINGDGTPDLVFITYTGTSVNQALIGKGDGTFPQLGTGSSLGSGRDILLADLDGDGRLDIIGTNTLLNTNNSVYMGSKVATSTAFSGVPLSAASPTTENITAQGVVTLDPTLPSGHGIGFHFVPSTAAQVTIKNGATTIGSATPTFNPPVSPATISNILVGGVPAVATVGANTFVAQFPGDARMFGAADSPIVNPSSMQFSTQPSSTAAGATMTPAVDVTANGIGSQNSPATVTIGLDHGSFVSGTTTAGTVNNFNTFDVVYNNIKIATPGTYNMYAMAGNTLIKSNSFNIIGGAATHLAYTVGLPTNTPAGAQQTVTVQAQDSTNAPANNYTGTVHFSLSSADGGATIPADYTFVSGDNSTHTFQVTLKQTGAQGLMVADKNNGSITSATSNTTVVAGTAANVTLNSPAAVQINQAFSNLVAHVTDGFGNPVSNVTVTFNQTAGTSGSQGTFATNNTATTDASGNATKGITANGNVGTFTVTATANSVTSQPSTLTILAGSAASLTVTQGSNQSATTGAQFATQFVVQAKDAGSNPVSAFSVTFTSPASGASCGYPTATSTSVNTDSSGNATVTCTANSTTGSYSVTASGSGVTSVNIINLSNVPAQATNINIIAGNNQSTTVNTNFGAALKVKIVDAGGNPIAGQFLQFTAPATGASGAFSGLLTTVVGPSAADGTATAPTFTANTIAGSYQVVVTFSLPTSPSLADARPRAGRPRPGAPVASIEPRGALPAVSASFNLTNVAGAATTLTKVAGDNQSAAVGTAFATALKVNATDAFSNPVSGAAVTFTPPASGASGTFASSATVNTDASGNATAPTFTANGTLGANYTVSASATGTNTVNFTLSNTAGNAGIMTIVGGNGQHATIGTAFATALQVKITDSFSNPLSGVSVTFAPPATGASGTFSVSATVTTNASGIASAPTYTANTVAGANGLKAVAGSLNQTFNLTNDPGAPTTMTPSGTPQSGVITQPYNTLSVKITDASNNPVPGQSVTFTAPASGAGGTFAGGSTTFTGTTDASGNLNASTFTANSTLGAFTVTATSGSLSAAFNLTNSVIPTAGIQVYGGSGQSTLTNTAFGSPLIARVYDTNGNSVAGASVTFTLPPSSGASGVFAGGGVTFTTTTNSQGLATTPIITANNNTGLWSVTATTAAFSTTFILITGVPGNYSVFPQVLQFVWEVGTPLPQAQFATVTSPRNQYSFVVDVAWVKAQNVPHGSFNDTISISVDPSNLPPGHYDGIVVIGDGNAILRVDLRVLPKPQINPSAKQLSFQYTVGDGIPSEQLVYITAMTRNFNVTVTTNYVTQTSVQWLKLVGDGTSTTPSVLHVSIAPAGLDPGTYTASIHIVSSDATNSPYDIPVTLTVSAASGTPTSPEIVGR